MSNALLYESKSRIEKVTKVALKLSSKLVGYSNGKNYFPYYLLLTNIPVSRLLKTFANVCSANIKLSKTQLHKIR